MDPYVRLLRTLLFLVIAVALFFGGRALVNGVLDFIQAPVQAELDASRGNNAALGAGVAAQNAGIELTQADGQARKERSRAAVSKAGEEHFNRAQGIRAAPAAGETDYERAVNRIDRELGLK